MPESSTVHPVTVVVPVYGDLPSLTGCIESLLATVDQSVHRVLLVNDIGPDADAIEAAILRLIDGQPAFEYARNPRNLGFVGNCNRAAFELDTTDNDLLFLNSDTVTTPGFIEELSSVLHASPQHGAVCPRSNNATIASLPFTLRDPSVGRGAERSLAVHSALRELLPRFSVSPVSMGFCLLVRRSVIREYGLFDEAFAPGYGEENDFCLRIAQHGYLSLIAHRAIVLHLGSRSFSGARRAALRAAHEKLVVERYPGYPDAVQQYLNIDRDPADTFADALTPGDDVARVLIDLDDEAATDGGALKRVVRGASAPGVIVTVSVADRLLGTISRALRGTRVIAHSRLDGQWDLALLVSRSSSIAQLRRLNRVSPRWAAMESNSYVHYVDTVLAPAHDIVDAARTPVDIIRLRARWAAYATRDRSGAVPAPQHTRLHRLARHAQARFPRLAGIARAALRR